MGQLAELAKLEQLDELAKLEEFLIGQQYTARTQLLVLQATPFCNLDCSYCYLPDRKIKSQMSLEVVESAVRFLLDQNLAKDNLSIVWHAGEPTVLPPDWYKKAYAQARQIVAERPVKLTQSMQTNGILLDDDWISYLKEGEMQVGLSIDGPSEVHDSHRKQRNGRGTHAQVMKTVETFHKEGIRFHVIAVITKNALKDPFGFCKFFESLGMVELGINFEEVEGINTNSTLFGPNTRDQLETFLTTLVEITSQSSTLRLREMRRVLGMLRDPNFGYYEGNDENTAFNIISVDTSGNLSTFSPELLGQKSEYYNNFIFGNVKSLNINEISTNKYFKRVQESTRDGIQNCKSNCQYFRLCHGGAPSNKLAETGSFATSETKYCQISIKLLYDIILRKLENSL